MRDETEIVIFSHDTKLSLNGYHSSIKLSAIDGWLIP